ncbi:MAG: tRNA (adenosine(37)-N6)-threonylcarbamoyltransferase complex ATPase subunit type 1 TsaE [Deltaproteobacteria bacterium]|nr:tRNA (adenosine(37)-N6)-threonylcarbamoyltransferase complex ATPase subunit type 1 TsaE [Deltaproteobacteria bacterium]
MNTVAVTSRSSSHTRRLAAALAAAARPGDLVALIGPLGCGKTCFVAGLVAALPGGEGVRVSSPTFTTVNTYPTTPTLYHVDLYRLATGADLDLIGYEEYYEGDGLCAVEWFDRAPQAAPGDYLELRFSMRRGTRRRLEAIAHGDRGRRLLDALAGTAMPAATKASSRRHR